MLGTFDLIQLTYFDCVSHMSSFLLKRLRTATLRSDFEGQAVLINCLMRNYLHYSLFKQAAKLVSKVNLKKCYVKQYTVFSSVMSNRTQ